MGNINTRPDSDPTAKSLEILKALERKILWLSTWTIHNANHVRKSDDDLKIGGHQASCASIVSIMTALYFSVLRPRDRIAVKPHASPVFHAIQYLMGHQTLENLKNFRGFGGAQAYPSRTKDIDDVDFSTGSVGLGVSITAFAALVQDYVKAKGWISGEQQGRMIALVGDAELDEGNIYECLQEGWKHGLRNTWWIIDYNRQSLDGVVHEGLSERLEEIFNAFGWDVIRIKYGELQKKAFNEPGGEYLRQWIDKCPNSLYSALTFQGGSAWRKRLTNDLGNQEELMKLLDRRSDEELHILMNNLGGHCLPTLNSTFSKIDHDRPVAFIAYTIKGWGTPLAGHKDNHAGLMTREQMDKFRREMCVAEGAEWDRYEGLKIDRNDLDGYLSNVPFFRKGTRRYTDDVITTPGPLFLNENRYATQTAFGKIMDQLASRGGPLADRIVTTSPDVTVSTNLGSWVNRRGLFSAQNIADTFRDERIASLQKWRFSPEGQHLELGIAEMNLFLFLAAASLSHSLFATRLLPVGTVYDPFISRGLDALNYACYQDARFLLVGTPSGVSLSHEGGAHQSIAAPLIGMSQDGLAAFEPAYGDELAIIMDWAFRYMQRGGDPRMDSDLDAMDEPDQQSWLRDHTGGSVYLRLSTRPIDQIIRKVNSEFEQNIINGAYWLRTPGANSEVVLAYQGCIAPEAIEAAGRIGEDRRDVGILSVTSADRLNAGWHAAIGARRRGMNARCHIETLLAELPPHCTLITIIDGHPATLAWMGGVCGHRTIALGVEHFGQTGALKDLYHHFGIDADSIVAAASELSPGRPIRHLRAIR